MVAAVPHGHRNTARFVAALLEATAAWAEERRAAGRPAPEVGAAVATGAVMLGIIRDHSRLEYTMIGEPVNLAAKLEKHTKEEGVRALCTAEAYRLARARGYAPATPADESPQCRVPGVGTPIDLTVLA